MVDGDASAASASALAFSSVSAFLFASASSSVAILFASASAALLFASGFPELFASASVASVASNFSLLPDSSHSFQTPLTLFRRWSLLSGVSHSFQTYLTLVRYFPCGDTIFWVRPHLNTIYDPPSRSLKDKKNRYMGGAVWLDLEFAEKDPGVVVLDHLGTSLVLVDYPSDLLAILGERHLITCRCAF